MSYFDMIEGSKILLKYPHNLDLDDNKTNQITKLLDVMFERSFFVHQFDFSTTANFYAEISSEWARGGKESILISVLLNAHENPENWKEPLEELVKYIETIPDIYKSFYYYTSNTDPQIVRKIQELESLIQNFYDSIPETITVQRIVKLFMFGLDRAGKTSISKRVSENIYEKTSPTLWLDVHKFQFHNFQFVCFDLGGQQQFRSFWKNYLDNSELLIFVIDGARPERFSEAKEELWKILQTCPPHLPLIVLNNKADLDNHLTNETIVSSLNLGGLHRPWNIVSTSAKNGIGFAEAFEWITNQLSR
ncbi:MAG: ADP-ribosylation factor family protein [Candidatus Helarchaeota archaeon]